jgi:prevent-host-death family protein
VVHLGARNAKNNFADLTGKVHYGGQTVIIERSGKPAIAMISAETYRQLIAEREARYQVIDRVRGRLPEASAGEVEQDVAETIAAVKADVTRRP